MFPISLNIIHFNNLYRDIKKKKRHANFVDFHHKHCPKKDFYTDTIQRIHFFGRKK